VTDNAGAIALPTNVFSAKLAGVQPQTPAQPSQRLQRWFRLRRERLERSETLGELVESEAATGAVLSRSTTSSSSLYG
jgi:hypothetical protein